MTTLIEIERAVPQLRERFMCGDVNINDITKWNEYQSELEREAPYGRCELCNLALMGDEHYRKEMCDNCAVARYGE